MSTTLLAPGPVPEASAVRSRAGRKPSPTVVILILSAAGIAFSVLQSLVAPALGLIAKDLHTSAGNASWILTAYLLSASVMTPILGRLGDMVGKRRMLLIVLAVLAGGTVVAGLATSLPTMIVGRALQGAAGGFFLCPSASSVMSCRASVSESRSGSCLRSPGSARSWGSSPRVRSSITCRCSGCSGSPSS